VAFDPEYLSSMLTDEILKRELIDSEEGNNGVAFVKKLHSLRQGSRRDGRRCTSEFAGRCLTGIAIFTPSTG
jgi:hypothetical protein